MISGNEKVKINWIIGTNGNVIDRIYLHIPDHVNRFGIYGHRAYSDIKDPIMAVAAVNNFTLNKNRKDDAALFSKLDKYKQFTVTFSAGKL